MTAAFAGLVLPVRGNAFFGDAVHLLGADLHLELMAARAHHRGVQRLVAVGAGNGDEVLDAAGHRPPQRVDEAEDRVAGGDILRDHADGEQIVDLVEGDFGALDLLEDGVEALDAPLDAGLDAVLAQLLDKRVFNAAQKLLAFNAARFDGCGRALVAHRIGVAEGQVLKLAAHLAHAQPMRERRVNIQRLARDGLLAVGLQVLQRAHVVQPVGQLDEHHAHIAHHGQQHLAHVFGLAVFAIGKLNFVDLGDALDDVRHLVAEAGVNLLAGGRRVFDRVVQQGRGNGRRVQLHFGQHFGHFERMNDVGLAGGAHLPLVVLDAELPRFADQGNVFIGAIGLNVAQKRLKPSGRWRVGRVVDGALNCLCFHRLRGSGRFLCGRGERNRDLCRNGVPDSRHTSL